MEEEKFFIFTPYFFISSTLRAVNGDHAMTKILFLFVIFSSLTFLCVYYIYIIFFVILYLFPYLVLYSPQKRYEKKLIHFFFFDDRFHSLFHMYFLRIYVFLFGISLILSLFKRFFFLLFVV